MKTTRLLIVLAVMGLYGCSDKDDAASGEKKTSLIEKAGQMSDELADRIEQGASEAGETASANKVGGAVESVKQAGSQAVESVVDASRSMTGSVSVVTPSDDNAVQESQQLVNNEALKQIDKASGEMAVATDSGQLAVDKVSDNTLSVVSAPKSLPGSVSENVPGDDIASAQNIEEKAVESASLETAAIDNVIDQEQVAMGKVIYSKHCMACHAAGVAGAPKVSDTAVWEPRIAQGMNTLYDHALNGFKGTQGYMPPKGGITTLNDEEVKAAVSYMVSVSQ